MMIDVRSNVGEPTQLKKQIDQTNVNLDCELNPVDLFKQNILTYVGETMGAEMHAMLLGVFSCYETASMLQNGN